MKLGVVGTGDRTLISEGTHTLTLKGCDLKEVVDRYSEQEGAMCQKLLWKFQGAQREDYAIWTNLRYGSDKASLTKLLDMMIPGITVERAAQLDTDDLVGSQYRARIVHKKNATSGKVYAQHTFLEPLEEVAQAGQSVPLTTPVTIPPAAPVTALTDPFADEE